MKGKPYTVPPAHLVHFSVVSGQKINNYIFISAPWRGWGLAVPSDGQAKQRQEGLPGLLQRSGPSAARDAAFHLGSFRHLLTKYSGIDFDGQRARGRYRRGKSLLSRMFRER